MKIEILTKATIRKIVYNEHKRLNEVVYKAIDKLKEDNQRLREELFILASEIDKLNQKI